MWCRSKIEKRPRFRAWWGTLLLSLAAFLPTGCRSFGPLRIRPVQASTGAMLQPHFRRNYYYVDRDGTYHFYLQTVPRTSGPAAQVTQIAIVTVFWRPIPGVTPILPSAINAVFRYLVFTPSGAGLYQGAGLVRLFNSAHARVMHAAIVNGDLRLTASSGYFRDALGPSRMTGDFSAVHSTSRGMALILRARRRFFLSTYRFGRLR